LVSNPSILGEDDDDDKVDEHNDDDKDNEKDEESNSFAGIPAPASSLTHSTWLAAITHLLVHISRP